MRAFSRTYFPRLSFRRRSGPAANLAVLTGACAALWLGAPGALRAQTTTPAPTPKPGFFLFRQPQRPVVQQIPVQPGAKIYQDIYDALSSESSHVVVSLPKQRVFLMTAGDEVAIDSPISSGRPGHTTPAGTYHISAKEPAHFSNIYGNFVDKSGRVVRAGISAKIDSAPSGTHYEGAPMRWFMRLTDQGVGMHVGILPGYPASHGCIRLPSDIAPLIYQKVKLGTTVHVEG